MITGKKTCIALLFLVTAVVFAACGGGGGGSSTPPPPASTLPVVTTGSATSTWYDNATLNGSVNPNGYATNAWFAYGTDSTLADNTVTDNVAMGSGTAAVTLTPVNIGGLSGDTTYYYALVAESSEGTVRGDIRSFATPAQLPTVTTGDGAPTSSTTATVHGTVNPNGYATTSWFEYGTSSTLATKTDTAHTSSGSGTGDIEVSQNLTVSDNTIYYYRFVASSSAGTSYGDIKSFTTPALNGPLADAGSDQTVVMRGIDGDTIVTLDGTGSTDPDGAGDIASYEWTQVSGTSVTLNTPAAATTTFSVSQLAYGADQDLVFQLRVTDTTNLTSTANVTVTVKWGWLDDFSTNTTDDYTKTGTGTLAYGAQLATLTTAPGAGTYVSMSREFHWDSGTEPAAGKGAFSIEFTPTAYYGTGGIELKLGVTPLTYYKVNTMTGIAEKFYSGNVVSSAAFTQTCPVGTLNSIRIVFDWNDTTVEVCGETVVMPHEAVDHNIASIYFTVTATNMDTEVDNFKMEKHPSQ